MPKFTSQEDVARWLNATSPGVSQVFAARAALRALPALAFTFRLHGNQLTSSEHANVALRTFGCLQVAWASSAYPGSHTKLVPAAGNAVSRSQNLSAEDVQRSAVYAVATASSTAHIIEFARVSANYAIEAVTGPREHFEAMLGAYSADAEVLDQRTSPVTLANSQLWPGRLPAWVGEAWGDLKRALLAADENWIVWTDWYEERLKGNPSNQEIEIARATIPNETWNNGPAVVNAHIRRLFRNHGISRYESTSAPEITGQIARLSQRELAAVGVRAALRAVPLIERKERLHQPELNERYFLLVLRAISSAWAVASHVLPEDHLTHANAIYTDLLNSPLELVSEISDTLLASANGVALPAAVPCVIKGVDAIREATFRKCGKAAEVEFNLALSEDLREISKFTRMAAGYADGGFAIATDPIWPDVSPPEWTKRWLSLKRDLLEAGKDWEVWIDWYEDRIAGTERSEDRELAYVEVPDELWQQGRAKVNAWIANRIYELEGLLPSTDLGQENTVGTTPSIPAQRPAAIEPVWINGRLTLPSKPAKLDLTGRKFTAALKSLREELRTFADDIAGEANIDKRFVTHVRRLADQIPQKAPRQTELFRLGHASVVFAAYAKTVDEQWPDLPAAQYHAIVLHFERTMLQSRLWREFKSNADQQVLTDRQIDNSFSLGTAVAAELRSEEARSFVDPTIPDALDRLTGPLLSRVPVGNEPRDDVVEAGTSLLAYDVVESVNNTVKRIAEEALKARALAGAATRNVGSTLGEAGKDYTAGVGKGFKRAAKKQGPIDGEKLFKLLRRIALTGGTLAGSAVTLPHLIAMYPQAFAWLQALLRFLH